MSKMRYLINLIIVIGEPYKMFKKLLLTAVGACAIAGSAHAGTYFEPLTQPNTNSDLASFNNAPFEIPQNYSQEFIASRKTLNAALGGDPNLTGEVGAFPPSFGNWDMIDFGGVNSEFIFIPHEVQIANDDGGAGVTRYNRDTGEIVILLEGNRSGIADNDPTDGWDHTDDDFTGLDPAVMTPAGTLLTGEEWGFGGGRLFELMNPTDANITGPADADWRWLDSIPSVSHEGLKFDKDGNLYFVDENSSGSIYKFEPKVGNDYSVGSTSVLVVGAGGVDGEVGNGQWVAITDMDNNALTTADPFDYNIRGGRIAADEVGGTGYCRPEDMDVRELPNGKEMLYVAATCANIVYSIELVDADNAIVREFVNSDVTPDLIGNNPVGTGNPSDSTYGLDDPDNVAIDAAGNVFIIEDENPGDIWQAVDDNKDGVAEYVALFASLGKYGSEPTGFIIDPRDPFTWLVAIQHPSAHENNDALWYIRHDVSEGCDYLSAKNQGEYVSCITKAAKDLGINGQIKAALLDVAANAK